MKFLSLLLLCLLVALFIGAGLATRSQTLEFDDEDWLEEYGGVEDVADILMKSAQ